MTDTTELAAWLGKQLDADEAMAEAASGTEWGDVEPMQPFVVFNIGAYRARKTRTTVGAVASVEHPADRAHIATHDPARVLRGIEAKRRILDWYVEHDRMDRETFNAEGGHAKSLVSLRAAYFDAVRALAAEYADRPGYREEWRP